jgi:DNA-binding NarL/FixJ family response regulator
VLISDNHTWNANTLRRCLSQSNGFVLVEAHPDRVLSHCQRLAPCVVIVDQPSVDRMDPAEFAALIDHGRAIKVLVCGASRDEDTIQRLVRKGCMGVVTPGTSAKTLRKAVRALARGEMWIERRLMAIALQQLLLALHSPKLSPREKDVLRLIASGYSNRAIAERLSITHETVRWHIRSLHAKLGMQDREGTALYARLHLEGLSSDQAEPVTAGQPL